MSSSIQAPSRSLLRSLKSSNQQSLCSCPRSKRLLQQRRCLSSTITQRQEHVAPQSQTPDSAASSKPSPRWAQTPPAMKAPVPLRPRRQPLFKVNGDAAVLDAVYTRFLGKNGPKMLSDETKWLAVTHKSFDHGRRGFNDRLSFLGRQIVEVQTSLGLLAAADGSNYVSGGQDAYGREPFHHPATQTAEVLIAGGKQFFMHHVQMSGIAKGYGLHEVVRWQPKDVNDLPSSGCDMVYTQALFAIVGALSLEQGGAIANQVVRERILQAAGLKNGVLGTAQVGPDQVSV